MLRAEKAAVEEETALNEALGRAVAERVEAALDAASTENSSGNHNSSSSSSQHPDDSSSSSTSTSTTVTRKDREKFRVHVQEIDKITSLLLGLSGRLARAENALANLPEDAPDQDRVWILYWKE